MKLYTFTHKGLSQIAKGIQAQHALARLFVKYPEMISDETVMLYKWAEDHETIVSLDGGTSVDLKTLIEFFEYNNSPYPWSYFVEDESFENMTTAVVTVLPERIYEIARLIRAKKMEMKDTYFRISATDHDEILKLSEQLKSYGQYTEFDIELIKKITYARTAQ